MGVVTTMPPVPPTRQLRKRSTIDERASDRSDSLSQPISTNPPSGRQTSTNLRSAPLVVLLRNGWQYSVSGPCTRHIMSSALPPAVTKLKAGRPSPARYSGTEEATMSPFASAMLISVTRSSRARSWSDLTSVAFPSSSLSRTAMHWRTSRSLTQSPTSSSTDSKVQSISL